MSTATKTRIGPADHGRRMRLSEFLDAEEVPGYLYELARGEIEVSNIPNDPHGEIIHKIHTQFVLYDQAHPGLIRRISEGSSVQLVIPGPETDRHPDLAVIFASKAPDARGRRMPDLVVEVVSPGRVARNRDYIAKREDYLAFGVLEYWIVDPLDRIVMVLSRPNAGAEWSERVFRDDEIIRSDLLHGFGVLVGTLWDQVDLDGDREDGE